MTQLACQNTTFLLVLNDNLWPNSAPVRYINFHNIRDLGSELSKSLKVKYHGAVVLPICFLLVFNGNVWPNTAPLQTTSLQNQRTDHQHLVSARQGKAKQLLDITKV